MKRLRHFPQSRKQYTLVEYISPFKWEFRLLHGTAAPVEIFPAAAPRALGRSRNEKLQQYSAREPYTFSRRYISMNTICARDRERDET